MIDQNLGDKPLHGVLRAINLQVNLGKEGKKEDLGCTLDDRAFSMEIVQEAVRLPQQ